MDGGHPSWTYTPPPTNKCIGAEVTCDINPGRMPLRLSGRTPGSWTSDRDLANLTTWPPMTLGTVEGRRVTLAFWSAVPSFGSDGNYIALLHPYDNGKLWEDSKQLTLFCSGPNRSHLSEVRAVGGETNVAYKKHLVFFCDWPAEDAHLESFDVFLEDQWGKQLGIVVAKRKPGLLQQYHTVACMRDVWRSPWTGLRQVPQWMGVSSFAWS